MLEAFAFAFVAVAIVAPKLAIFPIVSAQELLSSEASETLAAS